MTSDSGGSSPQNFQAAPAIVEGRAEVDFTSSTPALTLNPSDCLILVVDDLPQNLRVVGDLLDKAGYDTTYAVNGVQALERLQTIRPDLILLDLMMPEIDGLQVCRILHESPAYRDIPVIFLTASQDHSHLLQAFQAGAVDYVTKPCNPPELLARVHTHLELKFSRDRLQSLVHQISLLNQHLEAQVQQRTAALRQALEFEATLKQMTDRVRDSLDESQILQIAVQAMVETLQADACHTGIYDLTEGHTQVTHEHSPKLLSLRGVRFKMAEYQEIYAALFRGRSLQFCWRDHPSMPQAYLNTSVLACPIIDDQSVIGDLWLYRLNQQEFSPLEVRLVEQVATQCAIGLRQARLYRAAQLQVDELARLNRLKDDFLSTVSHELRTPMANIQMVANMMAIRLKKLQSAPEAWADAERYMTILQDESHREMSLINDLLDLAHLDARAEPIAFESLQLETFVRYVAEPFFQRAHSQGQQLEINLATDLPSLKTGSALLERVLSELLHNACKYTPQGGQILITACSTFIQAEQIPMKARPDPKPVVEKIAHCPIAPALKLQICNTGVNVPSSELNRMFDKFYRIPNNDPWKHGGTGLGLALVKKRVELLGGSIHAETQPDQLCMVLLLPLEPAAEMTASEARSREDGSP